MASFQRCIAGSLLVPQNQSTELRTQNFRLYCTYVQMTSVVKNSVVIEVHCYFLYPATFSI